MIRSVFPDQDTLDTDVCVIGTGAAGVTLAREFAGAGTRVCLLESGGPKRVADPDPHYDLHASALAVPTDSRVRAFGGTTTVWSGRWKRFDPIDFEPREWVPRSGWPVSYAELAPYYTRAARHVRVPDAARPEDVPQFLRSNTIIPTVFHTLEDRERDFGKAATPLLASTENIEVILGAHVMGFELRGRAISRVRVRAGMRDVTVGAKLVVLATGGIENARQLLLAGLGNEHDQVGRYFMDHPKGKVGVVETYKPIEMSSWKGLDESAPVWVGFRLADSEQRRARTLNSYVFLAPAFERDLAHRVARRLVKPRTCYVLDVRNYLEQAPDPDNRVVLSRDRSDPHGQPVASVAWTIGPEDRRTLVELHRVLARELQQARVGELMSPLLHGEFPVLKDASHHMGTTRMGSDPRSSVVDAQCRVHTVDNLFVAGSSVFPTSGYANPTATIATLAIRLADHLKARL